MAVQVAMHLYMICMYTFLIKYVSNITRYIARAQGDKLIHKHLYMSLLRLTSPNNLFSNFDFDIRYLQAHNRHT